MKEPFFHVVYCDDVRAEVGGKQSFMGVYVGEARLPQIPFQLPKLCVHAELHFPPGTKLEGARMVCRLNDSELANVDLSTDQLASLQTSIEDAAKEDSRMVLAIGFVFSPLPIEQPGKITISSFVNGVEYKGAGLKFLLQSEEERGKLVDQITASAQ